MKERKRKRHRWLRLVGHGLRRALHGRWMHGLILCVCAGVAILAVLLPVDETAAEHLGLRWRLYCFFNDAFGVHYTPAALIRSFAALSDGEWGRALHYHPVGPAAFAFVLFQIPYRAWGVILAPRPMGGVPRVLHSVFAAAVIGLIIADWLFPIGGKVF